MRLIDSDADVYPYVETWRCNCSEYGVQNVMSVDDVSTLPEIDPETLPIVRELRAQLANCRAIKYAEPVKIFNDPYSGRLFTTCSLCMGRISPKDKFCKHCGANLRGE